MSKALKHPRRLARQADEEHWIPLSDLMTGLMFLFLLIALAYMVQVHQQSTQTLKIIDDYRQQRDALYAALDHEFRRDLRTWNAELTPDLTIRFHEPAVLFVPASTELRPHFERALHEFFPRYVRILDSPKFRDAVTELRIEGTASSGPPADTSQQAYVGNMALSQDRARTVLRFVLSLPNVQPHSGWLEAHASADGLSSSHPVISKGKEDAAQSQRVDFRVVDSLWDRIAQSVNTEHDTELATQRSASSPYAQERPKPEPYSVDAVIVPNAEPAFINLDSHPVVAVESQQQISIVGWATIHTRSQPAAAVFARVDGARLIQAKYGDERDDVALALHDPALNHVGFSIDLAPKTLSPGIHHFDFIVTNASGKTDFVARNRLTLSVR